ncbi:MAG: helix-turn-helix transcriptional regulator [Clostridia bacterium]|nr:helix-turn-helix transcriptional regulator [Clostridia bacterium]
MILADKIINLRKKNGWSQEEFANKMNVSRQAVSKWEGSQTVPDVDKILQMSELFGVTTDYLLKDEIEDEQFCEGSDETVLRKVTLAQANNYLDLRLKASKSLAAAVFLCINSPLILIALTGLSEDKIIPLSENISGAIGFGALLLMVAIAVAIFIFTGMKNSPFEFLQKELFETEYGVTGLVKEKMKSYRDNYIKLNVVGACMCVIAPAVLIISGFSENALITLLALCATNFIVSCGVACFIIAGVRWESFKKLLQESEDSVKQKKKPTLKSTISKVYWLVIAAVYIAWGFIEMNWYTNWIVWPVGAILYAALTAVLNLVETKKEQ